MHQMHEKRFLPTTESVEQCYTIKGTVSGYWVEGGL